MESTSTPIPEEPNADISSFFSHLFGSHTDADKYSKIGQRGAIVTVHASSTEQAKSAAQILDKYDALDVHERAGSDQNKAQPAVTESITGEKQPEDEPKTSTDYVAVRSRIIGQVMDEEMRLRKERPHI